MAEPQDTQDNLDLTEEVVEFFKGLKFGVGTITAQGTTGADNSKEKGE